MSKKAKKSKPAKSEPLAKNRRKRKARRVTTTTTTRTVKREMRSNPPAVSDLTNVLLPGFGAYAATRTLARMVYAIVQKRWPKLGKHAHAAAGVVTFGGAWFFAHKIQKLAKYHDGVIMGSGLAALQGVAQAYLPEKYRWILADPKASDVRPIGPMRILPVPQASALPAGPADDDEFSYLESALSQLERTGKGGTIAAPRASSTPVANALAAAGGDADVQFDPDLMEALAEGEGVDDLYAGAFAPN